MKNYDNIIICVLIVFFLLFFIISSFIFVKDFITSIIADYNNLKEQVNKILEQITEEQRSELMNLAVERSYISK